MKETVKNWFDTVKVKWILVGILGYVFAVIFGIYSLIQPQFQRYQEAIDKQVGLDDTYINLISLDIEEAIRSTHDYVEDLKTLKSEFDRRLLKNKSVNSILPSIDRYCTQSKLKVEKLEPLNKSTFLPPKYQKHFVRIRLSGKYADFLNLLKKLESHPEWVLIEELTITPVGTGESGRYDLVFSVISEKEKA